MATTIAGQHRVRVSKVGYVEFETPDVDRMVDYYTGFFSISS